MTDDYPEPTEPVDPADVRFAAMNLLARREHSRLELKQKLRKRFPDQQIIDEQLQRLSDENLQSDDRYAESFVRQRIYRGHGPLRIERDVRSKGIDGGILDKIMREEQIDWLTLAQEAYRRKFGDLPPEDIREKARRNRFMQYRGFELEHFRHLLEQSFRVDAGD